ncbi:hypothetical protein BCR42DRAFT_417509 [Absidia repens]|uniref:Uncharacterized protein n=1 Tax=Absidia repens TaxID=90262 RepID=A0A1X2IDZ5_9FUNG|nr:hypothetical protein BCR42DRAFT_417509 [Absidia repens]
MKLNLTLLLLTFMTLIVLSHAFAIDKRGEDEDEPDEDEPDENEGGPPPPAYHPQQQQPPHKPKTEHSPPKKAKHEPETSPKQVMSVLPSAQDEATSPTSLPIFSYSATSTDLLMPTSLNDIPTSSSLDMPESTDLPPLGISSNANLSFFTPGSISTVAIALGSSMMVSFWL